MFGLPFSFTIQIHLMFLFIPLCHRIKERLENSNTSHVLIYRLGQPFIDQAEHHSNTSHVLIYLMHPYTFKYFASKFKYISCSYLSYEIFNIIGGVGWFKYISCSYLSVSYFVRLWSLRKFKYISCSYLSYSIWCICSYIILFKYISCSYLSEGLRVYLRMWIIQIHLMFLFIR